MRILCLLACTVALGAATVEPNNLTHRVVFDFPLITKFQGQFDPQVGFMYRATHEGTMTVSIYVEPAVAGVTDHARVKEHYWPKAQRNPEIDAATVAATTGEDRSVITYITRHQMDGKVVWLHHCNLYAFVDGCMVDVHISETTPADGQPTRLTAILSTVAFVPVAP